MQIDKRMEELGLELPIPQPPGALYVPIKRSKNLLFVSGHVPMQDGVPIYTGKIGNDRDIEYGIEAAKMCVLNMLSSLKNYCGNLSKIKEVIKLQIFVSSDNGFDKQHIIGNAASQILIDVFGTAGYHTRTAVGTNQLPLNFSVEIEGIFEVGDDFDEV